jgi:hypothetical protein
MLPRMRGGTILLIAGSCALIAAAGVLLYSRDREPSYNGRSLAQWVKVISQAPGDREAQEAIVCITTNSFPVLLRWAFADTTPFRLIHKLPPSVSQNAHLRPLLYRDADIRRAAFAIRAFEIAGTNAACAVPLLAAKITDGNPEVTIQAICMLPLFGATAVPVIRRAMTSRHPYVRSVAIGSFRRFGTNAAEAIPDVVKALSDYNINVRQNATNLLQTLDPVALTNSPAQ